MRDYWWELMEERRGRITDLSESAKFEITEDDHHQGSLHNSRVAIYHSVFAEEGFEATASVLLKLVNAAQEKHPNRKRSLYLDIDGHQNDQGGFDKDMFELQRYFLLGFLMPYLNELYAPLIGVQNNKFQKNDVPAKLRFMNDLNGEDVVKAIDSGVGRIWLAERDGWLHLPKMR
jgi:hypothetical protein